MALTVVITTTVHILLSLNALPGANESKPNHEELRSDGKLPSLASPGERIQKGLDRNLRGYVCVYIYILLI